MSRTETYRRLIVLTVIALACVWLTGCGRYSMRGVVVEGAASMIRVVDAKDPRLSRGYGLPLATIEATLDADRLSRKPLPREVSEVDGTFAVPVDEAGAGFLEYDIRMVVRRPGYNTAIADLRVPGPNQRLLVTLAKGDDSYKEDPPDVLDETLKMGEPYMP